MNDSLTYPSAGKKISFFGFLSVLYSNSVAAIGTYLLTNMLAHSAVFGPGNSALAALATYANLPSKSECSLKRSTIPFNCGIEMQQISPLNLSHGISIPQNQNNNDSQTQKTIKRMGKSSTRI